MLYFLCSYTNCQLCKHRHGLHTWSLMNDENSWSDSRTHDLFRKVILSCVSQAYFQIHHGPPDTFLPKMYPGPRILFSQKCEVQRNMCKRDKFAAIRFKKREICCNFGSQRDNGVIREADADRSGLALIRKITQYFFKSIIDPNHQTNTSQKK